MGVSRLIITSLWWQSPRDTLHQPEWHRLLLRCTHVLLQSKRFRPASKEKCFQLIVEATKSSSKLNKIAKQLRALAETERGFAPYANQRSPYGTHASGVLLWYARLWRAALNFKEEQHAGSVRTGHFSAKGHFFE